MEYFEWDTAVINNNYNYHGKNSVILSAKKLIKTEENGKETSYREQVNNQMSA